MKGRPDPRARRRGAARRSRAEGSRVVWPPASAVLFLLLWAALLIVAPPEHNGFWAFNGFRSLPASRRAWLILAAAAAALPAALRLSTRSAWWMIGAVLAVTLAFPLAEAGEFLGDTQMRVHAIAVFSERVTEAPIGEWSRRLHANPLDILVDFLLPIAVHRLGPTIIEGIDLVCALLAAVYFAVAWRLSERLGVAAETRVATVLALVLAGTLEAFAGYPESAGLLLVTAAWWWSEMLGPLARPRDAVRIALAWLVFFLAHRLALVMLAPMLWRAVGTPHPNDRPTGRRALLAAIAGATVIAAGVMLAGVGAAQLRMDAADMLSSSRSGGGGSWLPPSDVLNAVLLVAPLAVLGPMLAGRAGLAALARNPVERLVVLAVLVLLPLAWIVPGGPNGLGAHRDWDLNALLGISCAVLAGLLFARMPTSRLRGALILLLPVLALGTGSWVAVNADDEAVMRRARALAERPPRMADGHLARLFAYLGQRAMNQMRFQVAGPSYDRAFELNPNPRHLLLAAEAWAYAGDLVAARRDIARARTHPLLPSLIQSAIGLDTLVAHFAAESARAVPLDPARLRDSTSRPAEAPRR